MLNHKSLVFFNNSGDYLNFQYKGDTERFEGDILFDENSSDTFKTSCLYMFEKTPSFEYEAPGELTLDKFQLFNEFGIHFYGSKYGTQSIDSIDPINNDSNFYSKWIHGANFDAKFPIGTIIIFDSPIMEFTDINQTYTVVASKKNAIMIISTMDNALFTTTYYSIYSNPSTYTGKTITGINVVSVYNYVDSLFNNNLSNWSEPDFYDKYYTSRKLNIVNTLSNDGVVTIVNPNISDLISYEYAASIIPTNSKLIIEVKTRTDLPIIYEGSLNISSNGRVNFPVNIPSILKPGTEFKIVGSTLNTNFLDVSSVPSFVGNTQLTHYVTQSQVLWNNKTYQCLFAYTQSATSSITPGSSSYWGLASYVSVDQSTVSESLLNCQVYLTTDHLYFEYGWTFSNAITLASAAERYSSDLKLFNIDLYYKYNNLKADLIYPSKYAEVNFYYDNVSPTQSIGSIRQNVERGVRVRETLKPELNYDLSSNYKFNIVFTDIDSFGIKVTINKMLYQEEVEWIYTGSSVDMERTIDITLRSWLIRNYLRLITLGILPELQYTGNLSSVYYNSIILKTQYPNVPIDFFVEVGTTANYVIEHSTVLFTDMGGYLSFNINGNSYNQSTIFLTGTMSKYPNIPATLISWTETHKEYLSELGIVVSDYNNLLKFDIKDINRSFAYSVTTGKSSLPGQSDYVITNKITGNNGSLISSNEVLSNSAPSLEDAGFATGMVFSINNTAYPFDNQEYNIQYLDPNRLNLSYQGPFWGLTDSICNSSAFTTIAFSLGFGATGCSNSTIPGVLLSPFDIPMFDMDMFSLTYNPNSYIINTVPLNSFPGTSNMVDLQYVQISESIYALGDNITVIDAYLGQYVTTIYLPGNTQSMVMRYNPIDNYLYCLSRNKIYVVDPSLNSIIQTIPSSGTFGVNTPYDLSINTINGDIYVSYSDTNSVDIWNVLGIYLTSSTCGLSASFNMAFNPFEGDMYVTTDENIVVRIDGSTRTKNPAGGYILDGPAINHSIIYEPINESIYVYGSSSLWKIDNNSPSPVVSVSSQTFSQLMFNNLTGKIDISDSSGKFTQLDLNTDAATQTNLDPGGDYGYMTLNQFDGAVYLSSQISGTSSIMAIDQNGINIRLFALSAPTSKIVYNPPRKSVWSIQPSTNTLIEIGVSVNTTINITSPTYSSVGENLYGTLSDEYIHKDNIWLKTRDHLRRPRENFEGETQIKYYWRWFSDNIPQFFLYDFTGEQLSKTGPYAYTGVMPFDKIVLSSTPNRDISKTSLPEFQQTVFDRIEHTLEYINDSTDIATESVPMELFIGFNSPDEGALRSVLQLFKKEEVKFDIVSNSSNDNIITFETITNSDGTTYGQISLDVLSTNNFVDDDTNDAILGKKRGLKVDQILAIFVNDNTNLKKQYISPNSGRLVKIRSIYNRILIVDFINPLVDRLDHESTKITDYPKSGQNTYLTTTFQVWDREIGRFNTYGQTEIEDIRFKTELSNVGKSIGSNEVFIFKDYDINEGGIDWVFLNKKRKEMLMMKHLIYPYIGSYKSIINAINYFGYNDLQMNEYYRNIDETSENYLQLFKVEIPDIFDNTVDGWTPNDFIMHTMPNNKYQETNLFNLTYDITDKQGTNILKYSIDEVIIKLQGLKYWLKKNVIPLTHNILDITGKAYFVGGSQIQHKVNDLTIFNTRQTMTPITFKMNEAYLMPVNSGSTVYNCVLDFSAKTSSVLPDYYTVDIRTYKTYKEWAAFTTYNTGDKIIYYGKIYESQIDNNKVKNPRKYENIVSWSANTLYVASNITEYKRDFYVYSGLGSTSSVSAPSLDKNNWLNVTEWKQIDFEPVQKIYEYRNMNNILPFNFTIDSNIDPFLVVEVCSDNGYGLSYRDKKNYEVRGLVDLRDPIRSIDPIGPFIPISQIV